MLNTLPMEITFIDHESINRYFNDGDEPKLFKRPIMALNREVFSCHPPKIEPMVRAIIYDFRMGRRDFVDVWNTRDNEPILARYMAVRDKEKNRYNMTIYEYGSSNEKNILFIATAALEPYWAFQKQAERLAEEYHVYAVAADGHDGKAGDFISIEKTVEDMSVKFKQFGITKFYGAYGLSMGGAIVVRFLATSDILVEKAIIDGGILPYIYPKWICKLIHVWDYITMRSITRSRRLLELVAPPEKYTAEGNNPKEEYDNLMEFYKTYSNTTISNVFWSANNYKLPYPAPKLKTDITYWYGEYEKRSRKKDMTYIRSYFDNVKFTQIDGMGHGELVMVHLSRFDRKIKATLETDNDTEV